MAGRKPLGPALVEHLEGSSSAKERLELILATIAGQITVVDAADRLGISEAMFYKVRTRVLQTCLQDLEPKPLGRPPAHASTDQQQRQELESQVEALQRELAAHEVRLELMEALPHVVRPTVKKTNRHTLLQQKLRRRRAK
jgi:transposase-like protein